MPRPAARPMPRIMRLYLRQSLLGFGLAALFTALLLAADVGGLRHLVTHTEDGPLAVMLLVVFNGIVFAGAQFGIAVMRLAAPDDAVGGAGGGSSGAAPAALELAPELAPVRVAQPGSGRSSVARR